MINNIQDILYVYDILYVIYNKYSRISKIYTITYITPSLRTQLRTVYTEDKPHPIYTIRVYHIPYLTLVYTVRVPSTGTE